MPEDEGALEIHLHRSWREVGGLRAAQDITYRLGVPKSFTEEDLQRACRDYEIFGEIMRQQPEKMQQALNHALQGDMQRALEISAELGLKEEQFVAKGGGLPIAVIIIAVGAALLLAHD